MLLHGWKSILFKISLNKSDLKWLCHSYDFYRKYEMIHHNIILFLFLYNMYCAIMSLNIFLCFDMSHFEMNWFLHPLKHLIWKANIIFYLFLHFNYIVFSFILLWFIFLCSRWKCSIVLSRWVGCLTRCDKNGQGERSCRSSTYMIVWFIVSYYIILYHIISYYIISYHIISYYIISYNII